MKKIDENTKVTITLGQIRKLVREAEEPGVKNEDVLADVSILFQFYSVNGDGGWSLSKVVADTLEEVYAEPLNKLGRFVFWLRSKGPDPEVFHSLSQNILSAFVFEKPELTDLVDKIINMEYKGKCDGDGLGFLLEYLDDMFRKTLRTNIESDIGDSQEFDNFNYFFQSKPKSDWYLKF